jgi:hypothetical protein
MRKILPALLIATGLLIAQFDLKAQTQSDSKYFVPTFYPKAPNTAALEKFGSYDVNLFTGVPNISIPLYTIEAGGFKIPITLSYHASGIRVSEVSSWAGLGWAISTGGNINRKVQGGPDDGDSGYLRGYLRSVSSFHANVDADVDELENIVKGTHDTRPDIFSYDFPGHGGKFFFDGTNSYKPTLIPYAPIVIKNTGMFSIIDENGNNYSFGNSVVETSYSSTQEHPAVAAVSGWPLEKMISQNRRDTVSFTYSSQYIYYPDVTSQTDIVTDQINNNATAHFAYGYVQGPTSSSSSYVQEQLVHQIFFKNGRVDFNMDTSNPRQDNVNGSTAALPLHDIKVYSYNYTSRMMELQKTIVFYHSYFNPTVSTAKRLKLDGIDVLDKAGATVQHYSFTYNTTVSLPYYTSLAKDYWGFYNGKANDSFTPNMTIPVTYNNFGTGTMTIGSTVANSRECDSTYMQAFTLQRIDFPTGGHTDFTYQTNRYLDAGNLKLAGGLRVASISSYDGISSTPIIKTYQYDNNAARKNFILDNCFFSTSQFHQNWVTNSSTGGILAEATAQVRTFVSNPRIDLEAFDAAAVVYPKVSEYTGTPATNIGKTDYLFRDLSDQIDIASMTGTIVIKTSFYERGQLSKKTEYLHKADGSYQISRVDSNSYTAFPYTTYTGVGLVVGKNVINEGNISTFYYAMNPDAFGANGLVMANYDIKSDDNYLTGTQSRIYDSADPTKFTSSTISYKFDNIRHQQISRTYHTDSKGNTTVSKSKYAADYQTGSPATSGNLVLDSMVNRNMQTTVIERYDTLKNAATSVNAITSAQFNAYKTGANSAIVPDKIYRLSAGAGLTNFSIATSGSSMTKDSRYVQMISFDNYDGNNNIVQYTPRNSTPVSVIWDYLSGQPIAQVKNAIYSTSGVNQNIAYTGFEADGKGNWTYSGTPLVDITAPTGSKVYDLSTGTIYSQNLDNTKSYVVSYYSKSTAASVYGSSSVSGTAISSTGGWTYYEHIVPAGPTSVNISGSVIIDELRLYPVNAQMTTYTYNPSGLTAIADTKGSVNHYEYDFFNRLKNIKDWNGNIVKNFGYHTYDQTIGNDAMTATFTRNNCPSGTTPGSLSYTVPINKYLSSTKTSANAEATYDMNINGQAKANANCGCPIHYVNVTFTNSSGFNGFQASFTGGSNPVVNFPSTGSTATIAVPEGTYSSVYIGPIGSGTHTFTLGSRTPVTDHYVTFTTVVITTGSTDLSFTIN